MEKSTYVLGISYSHDASVCLLKDGIIAAAIQKERLTGKKHDGSISDINLDECINYCLKKEGVSLSDIDLVIENSPTILYCKEKDSILGFKCHRVLEKLDPKKIVQISHHLAHAYCAYGLSNFSECAALVIDGQGNYKEDLTERLIGALVYPKSSESSYIERESFYEFKDGKCKVLRKNLGSVHKSFFRICGLGHLYETVSAYLFSSRFDAGKVMGLAPYGNGLMPFKMISARRDQELFYHKEWINKFTKPNRSKQALKKNWREYANLAIKVQTELEIAAISLALWLKKNSLSDNLCYSGGVALNCSANRKIAKKSGFKKIFIAPPASDCGISVGCAFYGYYHVLGKKKKNIDYLDYLGKEYEESEIKKALRKHGCQISFYRSKNIEAETAALIASKKIIAWFQGKSEFGPRALGNRSIVGDPRYLGINSRINKIKKRESFRPLAPSVLEEKAGEYFDISYSPYMLLAAKVKKDKAEKIPAVTHVDGTARIQTVNKNQNLRFYSLINEFYKITGVPLVINTSFNVDGPIVETPDNALECFLKSGLDRLCIGNFIASKKKLRQ